MLACISLHKDYESTHSVTVTVIENGPDDLSSNPGQGYLYFLWC